MAFKTTSVAVLVVCLVVALVGWVGAVSAQTQAPATPAPSAAPAAGEKTMEGKVKTVDQATTELLSAVFAKGVVDADPIEFSDVGRVDVVRVQPERRHVHEDGPPFRGPVLPAPALEVELDGANALLDGHIQRADCRCIDDTVGLDAMARSFASVAPDVTRRK